MRILSNLKKFRPDPSHPLILALGNFDGVHQGHQRILEKVRQSARAAGGTAAVFTFAVVCLVTSFVCTAVKEDEDRRLAWGTARLFGVIAGGIVAFGLLVQVLTWMAV